MNVNFTDKVRLFRGFQIVVGTMVLLCRQIRANYLSLAIVLLFSESLTSIYETRRHGLASFL
jgi:hypothetical protein